MAPGWARPTSVCTEAFASGRRTGGAMHQSGARGGGVIRRETVVRQSFAMLAVLLATAGCGKSQGGELVSSSEAEARPVEARAAHPATKSIKPVEPARPAAAQLVAAAKPAEAAPAVRSEHAAFALVDNRHAAHRYSGGDLVLDASDVGFAKYTRFSMPAPRWELGQDIEGERAAVADRLATLEVPLTAAQAKAITFVTMH